MSDLNMIIEYEYTILKYAIDKKHKWINKRIICLKELIIETTTKE